MTDLTEVKTVGIVFYIYIVIHAGSLLQLSHLFPPYHSNAEETPIFLLEQQPLLQHHQLKHPLKKNKGKKYNMSSTDAPAGDVQDNSYVNRPGQNEYNVPVVKDDTAAAAATEEEEGGYTDESTADSDAQLGMYIYLSLSFSLFLSLSHTTSQTHQPSFLFLLHFFPFSIHLSLTHSLTPLLPTTAKDDLDIDKTNILESRTRGAAKDQGSYTEPGDEEGLPGPDEDGTSRGRQQ